MKKLLIALIALIIMLSACNKSETSENVNTPKSQETIVVEAIENTWETTNITTPEPIETEQDIDVENADNEYPEAFSWKNDDIIMTPQNQDPLGSCAVFAVMSMFETHIAMTTGSLPDLSEMHFVSTSDKWSDETGVSPSDVLDFIKDEGVITEEKLPYIIPDAGIDKTENDYGYDYILDADWGSEMLDGNELDERINIMKRNILDHGPVITNIGLYNDLGMYTDGIYTCDTSSGVVAGHWLVILGWQDDDTLDAGGYWICKNSWGTQWGEDGFCKISYGDESGIDDYILYFIDTPEDKIDAALVDLGIEYQSSVEKPDADYLKTYTLKELQDDFDMFTDTLLFHNTFTFSDKDEFETMADALRDELEDNMSEIEFYRILSKMISFINCGHSKVSLSPSSESIFGRNNYFMPLDIKYREDKMYLIGNESEIVIPLGSQILSVNKVDINDIIDEMYAMMPSDGQNTTYKKKLINENFYYWYNLLYDNTGQYFVEFVNSETGTIDTVRFTGVDKIQAGLSAQNIYKRSRLDYTTTDKYVYLRIPNFNTIGRYTIADYEDFFSELFADINEQDIHNLIIDVRDNNGGHPEAANILLSYLADSPFQYFDSDLPPAYPNLQQDTPIRENNYKGSVYVICDGGSLSTTGHFLALFKYHDMGYIVGEESGAGHTCTDASFDTTLPNTKITFRSSSVKWNVAVEAAGEYRGVMPDYPFSPTVDDMINNVDSVLYYTISLIGGE